MAAIISGAMTVAPLRFKIIMVRWRGFEPPRLAAIAPQAIASAIPPPARVWSTLYMARAMPVNRRMALIPFSPLHARAVGARAVHSNEDQKAISIRDRHS